MRPTAEQTNICEDLETENFKLKQEVREATSRADALERELKSEQKRSGLINQVNCTL